MTFALEGSVPPRSPVKLATKHASAPPHFGTTASSRSQLRVVAPPTAYSFGVGQQSGIVAGRSTGTFVSFLIR